MSSLNSSNVISINRVYDAPLQAVWEAWALSEKVSQWWGPRGFSLTHHDRNLKSGGHWHYTMHGPDGTDYENTTQYLEVLPMQKLVYDHGGHQDRPPLFRVTAQFNAHQNRTELSMQMAFASAEIAQEMQAHIRQAGGDTTWDRLGEFLAKQITGKEVFLIARSFHATVDRLYEMLSSPDLLAQWLAPTGASMKFLRTATPLSGTSFYEMSFNGGEPMHGLINYLELSWPHRIAYTQQFCDATEQVIRPVFFEHWPLQMRTQIELVQEDQQTSRITLCWTPEEATSDDINQFVNERAGMTMGWTGSFDKLESLLKSQ
ncbi:MAG: hypothetical protein RL462_982 [Pseudomonadota bacterium]